MSEVKLVLRDATRDLSSICHGSCADRAIAALSADPVTIEELEVALERFRKPGQERFLNSFAVVLDDKPWDAGVVVIDLAAKLVAAESSYSSPAPTGRIYYHDGECCTDMAVQYDVADGWMFSTDMQHWKELAQARRRERATSSPLDSRAILYGRPMIEFLATECFKIFPKRDAIAQEVQRRRVEAKGVRGGLATSSESSAGVATLVAAESPSSQGTEDPEDGDDDGSNEDLTPDIWPGQEWHASPFYDTFKEIHARWLMTPRADLRGEIPREVLLAEHEHLMCDMQHRCDQWARMQECPRGLDETSHAFRLGGFGTHELVKYYDLIRALLWSCWERLTELGQSANRSQRPESFSLDNFLAAEVPRLERVREAWLDTPDPDCDSRTPRSLIQRERARLPEVSSPHDRMIDPDCPCCRMLADLPGPMFWHLDGSGMDWEFPFDIYHRTHSEWAEEQGAYNELSEQFVAKQVERQRLGVEYPPSGSLEPGSVWSRSFSVADRGNVPLGIRLFGIGGHLAELIVDLREAGAEQSLLDQLNRSFGNLREVLGGASESLGSSLIEPVVAQLREMVDSLAAEYSKLEPKCADLCRQLNRFLEPPTPDMSDEFLEDDLT